MTALRRRDFVVVAIGVICTAAGIYFAITGTLAAALVTVAIGCWLIVRPLWIARRGQKSQARTVPAGSETRSITHRVGRRFLIIGIVCLLLGVAGVIGVIPEGGGGKVPFIVLFFPGIVFSWGGIRAIRD